MTRSLDDKSFCARPLAIGAVFVMLFVMAVRKAFR